MAEMLRLPSGLLVAVDHQSVPPPEWVTVQSCKRILNRHYPDWRRAPFYDDATGWKLMHQATQTTIIVSGGRWEQDAETWVHASISHPTTMPTYDELKMMHEAVFGARFAYQVFAPPTRHVNGHPYCLHLWGRDGDDAGLTLPDFGKYGVI